MSFLFQRDGKNFYNSSLSNATSKANKISATWGYDLCSTLLSSYFKFIFYFIYPYLIQFSDKNKNEIINAFEECMQIECENFLFLLYTDKHNSKLFAV